MASKKKRQLFSPSLPFCLTRWTATCHCPSSASPMLMSSGLAPWQPPGMLPGCVPNYPLFLGLQTSLFCYWSESVGLHWSIEQRGVEDGIRWSYLEWQNRTVDHSIHIITVWMAALGNSVVRDRVECMWALQIVWYHLELKWGVGGRVLFLKSSCSQDCNEP